MMRKTVMTLVVVMVFGGIFWYHYHRLNGAGIGKQKNKKVKLVSVCKAKTMTLTETLNLTGRVVATNSVTLTSTVDGLISYCPWREGDQVKCAEPVIKINRPLFVAETGARKAALQVAEAKLADLKSGTRPEEIQRARELVKSLEVQTTYTAGDLERNEKLGKKSVVSGDSVELARVAHAKCSADLAAARDHLQMLIAGPTKSEIAIMEAQVKEATALLKVAETKVAECVLLAPFDGIVTKTLVRQGDLARAKEPLIELMEPASIVVRFGVPEQYARFLAKGRPVQLLMDACCDQYIASTISLVFPKVDENTHTFLVEARLPGNCRSSPGMFARVRLPVRVEKDAIVVPLCAVLTTTNEKQVLFVMDGKRAVKRSVTTGLEQDGFVQIVSGVSTGEQVITAGNERLKDGMTVKVKKKAESPGRDLPAKAGKKQVR